MILLPLLAAATIRPQLDTPVIPKETKAQYETRMRWWHQARFGMFIHWGLYSIPAGVWNGQTGYAEWIREEAHIPVHEYEKLQPKFNPVKFNANTWAKLAKDAGMKYVVITTKHHDGFNLFDSKYTDWSVKNTPFHRDIMRELSTAVRGQGLTMGWYHSIMDWHHPDYLPRRSWEGADRPADGANFRRFVKYLRNDVTQLLTDYGPIGVMWFDGEWENTWNKKDGNELYALCRTLQPNVIVNNRVSVGRGGIEDAGVQAGDYGTPEQTIPATGLPGQYWETCMTMNGHWGYNSHDTDWKSSKVLLRNLMDIASKGGNYLLNIGPRSDGTFPPEAVDRLHDIGKWMHTNGESIYDTTASVFDGLPWGRSTTKRQGSKTTLYFHVFDMPADGRLVIPGLGNKPLRAHVLGQRGSCSVDRGETDVVVHVPTGVSDSAATVVALEVAGAPIIYKAPKIEAPTTLVVKPVAVHIVGSSPELWARYTLDGTTPTAASPVATGAIMISGTETLKTATFQHDRRVSTVTEKSFKLVQPNPAADGVTLQPGLRKRMYRGEWTTLPSFDNLTPVKDETATSFGVPMDGSKFMESVGLRYTGYVTVPADDVYAFNLTSDDGSALMIDGERIVNNDGLHSDTTERGTVALAKGPHKIEVVWFNGSGGSALRLTMGPVGGTARVLSASMLGHE